MPTPLPARNILDGSSNPTTSTMKGALGALRDYLAEKLGADAGGPVVTSLNGGQLAGFRNLLINGNFQVNERAYASGAATTSANQYTLDRWRVVVSGQSLVFVSSGSGNAITAPAGGVEQVIEGVNIGGGTYVLNWTGTATATVNGTARAKGEGFTLPAGTNATVQLAGGTASLVQLEPGTMPTPFEHLPLTTVEGLCRRYFFNLDGIFNLVPTNESANTNSHLLPVVMRATPSVAITISIGTGATFGANSRRVAQAGIHSIVSGVPVLRLSAEL